MNSSELYSVIAILLISAAGALLLKNFGFKGAPVFVAVCMVFVISSFSETLSLVKGTFNEILTYADISEYTGAAMKVVGIGYLSGISSDVCREIGEGGVAKCIAVVSKLELITIAAPFISELVSLCAQLLGE